MSDTDEVPEVSLAQSVELASSILDQLGEAFGELEAHKLASGSNLLWKDIEGYFRNLESNMKKKVEDLQAKEQTFTETESHNNMLLAEREAAVVAKEQDVVDKVQELKDAAVAAIFEARAISGSESLETVIGVLTNGTTVSSSVDDENMELDAPEGNTSHGENVDSLAVEANPREELIEFCQQMDSKGILKFIMENHENPSAMCKEVSVALGSATEPAKLVLDALQGFFPPSDSAQQGENSDAALHGMRRSCLILLEALSAFMSKADNGVDAFITPDTKQQATSIAYEWNLNLAGLSIDATNEITLEAEVFLRLLATFRITSEFNGDELCKYVLAVSHHRQATELCHSLELSQKIPGLVETLINSWRHIDAVHFIHAFQLSESIPSVPLLRIYLKELRRNIQGNGSAALQSDLNTRELEAIRAVIECVEDYKLEAEYPLDTLYRRVYQLDKSAKDVKKRTRETREARRQALQEEHEKVGSESISEPRPEPHREPRPEPRREPHRGRGSASGRHGPSSRGGRQGPSSRGGRRGPPPVRGAAPYAGIPNRYNPVVPAVYSYPVSTPAQPVYVAQASDPRLYYYTQNDPARKPYSAVAPPYPAVAPPYPTQPQQPQQPYM